MRDSEFHRFAFCRFFVHDCLNRPESAASSLIYLHSRGASVRISVIIRIVYARACPISTLTTFSQYKISLLPLINCKSLTNVVVLYCHRILDKTFLRNRGSSKFYPESNLSVRRKFLLHGNCSQNLQTLSTGTTWFFFCDVRCYCRLEMYPRNEVAYVYTRAKRGYERACWMLYKKKFLIS